MVYAVRTYPCRQSLYTKQRQEEEEVVYEFIKKCSIQEVVQGPTQCFKVTRTRQYTKKCADLLAVPLMYIFQDISGQFFT